jgi:hypothetical protein
MSEGVSEMTTIHGDLFTQTYLSCGRAFGDLGVFTCHEKGCNKGKKRLSSALSKAKEVYRAKKARLTDTSLNLGLVNVTTGFLSFLSESGPLNPSKIRYVNY